MSTLIEEIPVRDRQGSVWEYVSPSRLNTWLSCPLKFRLKYIDGIRTPPTPSLFLGKIAHSVLERFYRHRQLGIALSADDLVCSISATWDQAADDESMSFESGAAEDALKSQATALVRAYVAHVPEDEPRPLGVEVTMQTPLVDPFTGENLGVPLLGIVDLILGGDGGPVIVDFKTSARSAPPFEITHEVQLSSYAYLYRQVSGQSETALEIRSLIKTKQPKIEVHDYARRTEAHLRRLFLLVHEYLDSLDTGRFNHRPGWGCGMCDFREGHCRAWQG